MDDLLSEFLTECGESMTLLEAELVRLERDPDDPELLAVMFRRLHTIKGTCGFFRLSRLEALAHAVETVFGRLRDRELAATATVVSLALAALDRIMTILAALATDAVEPAGDDSALIAALDAAAQGLPVATTARQPSRAPGGQRPAAPSLRVPVDLLEQLAALAGELALTRDQLVRAVGPGGAPALAAPLRRLSRLTGALQAGVARTRMQAIGTAWRKLPRLIRDLALELGKEIELAMLGAETELDRHVLELLEDPLTHMVRNAADHGLERPVERRRLGKPERGTIRLAACRRGGRIFVEIGDDGRGLDTRRIVATAIARGIATKAALAAMPEGAIQRLILHPGFSTAETVTALSGRGVGMDVVRANIERIGGAIRIRSRPGRGAVFTIEAPISLPLAGPQTPAAVPEAQSCRPGRHRRRRLPIVAGAETLPSPVGAAAAPHRPISPPVTFNGSGGARHD